MGQKIGGIKVAVKESLPQYLAVQFLNQIRSPPWFWYVMCNQNRIFFLRHTPVSRHKVKVTLMAEIGQVFKR